MEKNVLFSSKALIFSSGSVIISVIMQQKTGTPPVFRLCRHFFRQNTLPEKVSNTRKKGADAMKMKKFGGTEKVVYDLVKPIADEQGYSIWDVSFEKEGAYWYLRVFIDHPDGIDIEDCEKMTRPVNAAVDAADPISQAYVLEVGSAGLERELNQPQHFAETLGMEVRARAIRPINGEKEWIGILTAYDTEQITIQPEEQEAPVTLPLADLSYVRRYVTVEF